MDAHELHQMQQQQHQQHQHHHILRDEAPHWSAPGGPPLDVLASPTQWAAQDAAPPLPALPPPSVPLVYPERAAPLPAIHAHPAQAQAGLASAPPPPPVQVTAARAAAVPGLYAGYAAQQHQQLQLQQHRLQHQQPPQLLSQQPQQQFLPAQAPPPGKKRRVAAVAAAAAKAKAKVATAAAAGGSGGGSSDGSVGSGGSASRKRKVNRPTDYSVSHREAERQRRQATKKWVAELGTLTGNRDRRQMDVLRDAASMIRQQARENEQLREQLELLRRQRAVAPMLARFTEAGVPQDLTLSALREQFLQDQRSGSLAASVLWESGFSVCMFGPDLRVIALNPEFTRRSGFTRDDISRGLSVAELVPAPQLGTAYKILSGMVRGEMPPRMETAAVWTARSGLIRSRCQIRYESSQPGVLPYFVTMCAEWACVKRDEATGRLVDLDREPIPCDHSNGVDSSAASSSHGTTATPSSLGHGEVSA